MKHRTSPQDKPIRNRIQDLEFGRVRVIEARGIYQDYVPPALWVPESNRINLGRTRL